MATNTRDRDGFFGTAGTAVDKGISSFGRGIGNLFSGFGNQTSSFGGAGDSGQEAERRDANRAANKAAAAMYAAMPQQEQRGGGGAGIASLLASLAEPTMAGAMSPYGYTLPAPLAASLAAPPTSVPGPVEVPTMGYPGGPAMGAIPAGYGSAFAGLSQPMANPYAGINFMDIFSMYPDLRYM